MGLPGSIPLLLGNWFISDSSELLGIKVLPKNSSGELLKNLEAVQ